MFKRFVVFTLLAMGAAAGSGCGGSGLPESQPSAGPKVEPLSVDESASGPGVQPLSPDAKKN